MYMIQYTELCYNHHSSFKCWFLYLLLLTNKAVKYIEANLLVILTKYLYIPRNVCQYDVELNLCELVNSLSNV